MEVLALLWRCLHYMGKGGICSEGACIAAEVFACIGKNGGCSRGACIAWKRKAVAFELLALHGKKCVLHGEEEELQ